SDLPPPDSVIAAAVAVDWQRVRDESAGVERAIPASMTGTEMTITVGQGEIVLIAQRPTSLSDLPAITRRGVSELSTSVDDFKLEQIASKPTGIVAIVGLLGIADLAVLWLRGDWKRRLRRYVSVVIMLALPVAGILWFNSKQPAVQDEGEEGWWVPQPRALENVSVEQTADGHRLLD
ncbi:MAG: hypothetical protein AAGK78_14325, partial [Planctomycetota bacterium]